MKKVIKTLGILTLTLAFSSCSTVKVANTWKDVKTSSINEKNVLVINKTDNDIARIQFETDMVNNLISNGIKATESFKVFPEINGSEKLNEEQLECIKEDLKSNGVDVVLLTVLKETQDYEKTTTTGGSYYMITHPVYYGRGYHRGIYRYYNTFYVNSEPITSVTSNGKKYILETITYDLTQPKDKQLLSVITTEIDNPETLETTSKDFSKKVIKELVK
jgi:hypothetical protein